MKSKKRKQTQVSKGHPWLAVDAKQTLHWDPVKSFLWQHHSILICDSPRQLKVAKTPIFYGLVLGVVPALCCAEALLNRRRFLIFSDHFYLSWDYRKHNLSPTTLSSPECSCHWCDTKVHSCLSCGSPRGEMLTVAAGPWGDTSAVAIKHHESSFHCHPFISRQRE